MDPPPGAGPATPPAIPFDDIMTRHLLVATALALLAPAALAQEPQPQDSWMVHVDGSGDSVRFVPDRLLVVPGGIIQLMIFGQGHGRYSLTLDEPGYEAEVDTSAGGVMHVAEFAAPKASGEYAFRDRHHESARGTLIVQRAAPSIGVGDGYDTRFYPDRFELRAGETFAFRNNASEIVHTFTLEDGSLDTDRVAPGETRTLDAPREPGEYPFVCKYHQDGDMRGTLVVLSAEADAPAEATEARAQTPGAGTLAVLLAVGAACALAARRR